MKRENSETNISEISLYLQQIRPYPILKPSEQQALALKGDFDTLIKCNLKLVVSIAKKYSCFIKNLTLMDLIEEGNLCLIIACRYYNPAKGSFTTYASKVVRNYIYKTILEKEQNIRIPKNRKHLIIKYLNVINDLQYETPPSDEELCKILNISLPLLESIKKDASICTVSSNITVLDSDDAEELEDFFIDENSFTSARYVESEYNLLLLKMIKCLLSRVEYYVIYNRFLTTDAKLLENIGEEFKLSRQRVFQIQNIALNIIKPILTDENVFNEQLNKVKDKLGSSFESFHPYPINPLNIIIYYYLENELTELEKEVFRFRYLSDFEYTNAIYIQNLGITLEELLSIYQKLEHLIKKTLHEEHFKEFQQLMIETYKTKIYDLIDNTALIKRPKTRTIKAK